mmetsp:Transcript_6585/g.19840  ORF Transcript_6585/g.19840 Transcript_6585/m.19840 type:complete len:221 (-) Transcript_6585:1015-1677(-)
MPACVRMSFCKPMVSMKAKTRPLLAEEDVSSPIEKLSCRPDRKPSEPGGLPALSHGVTIRRTCQSLAGRSGSRPKSGLPSSSRSSESTVRRKGDSNPGFMQYGTITYGASAAGSNSSMEFRRPTRGSACSSRSPSPNQSLRRSLSRPKLPLNTRIPIGAAGAPRGSVSSMSTRVSGFRVVNSHCGLVRHESREGGPPAESSAQRARIENRVQRSSAILTR